MSLASAEPQKLKKDKRVVALYARTSSTGQEKGLDAQVRALRDYCSRNEIKDYIIFEDDGISGIKDSRPALNRMMKDVEDGKVKKVLVYSFSRYARSTTHLLKALESFEKREVAFHSLTENIATDTPLGLAVYTILGAIAQLERDILRERVTNGLRAAKARGTHIGRKKTRPSHLIRRMRAGGSTYREIQKISGVSSGAIAAELREWEKEKREGKETILLEGDLPQEEQQRVATQTPAEVAPASVEEKPVPTIRF